MIFSVAMPILFGFANYLVPVMIGRARPPNAFPRLKCLQLLADSLGGCGFTLVCAVRWETDFTVPVTHPTWAVAYAPVGSRRFEGSQLTMDDCPSVSGFGSIGTRPSI